MVCRGAHLSGFLPPRVAVRAEEMVCRCRPDRRLPTSAAGGGGGSCPTYTDFRHLLNPWCHADEGYEYSKDLKCER